MPASALKKAVKKNIQNIVQGDYAVSNDPERMLTTVLGSCVAVCLFDPVARVGGMNHFLLPGGGYASSTAKSCGLNMMELLINGLLKSGAKRENFQAKLFGGAHMIEGLTNIGSENAKFALDFLDYENISVVGKSLGGDRARRVRFWPTTGQARQKLMDRAETVNVEKRVVRKPVLAPVESSDLELF